MKKITLFFALLSVVAKVNAQKIINQIACTVQYRVHCQPPGFCGGGFVYPVGSGPVIGNVGPASSVFYPSVDPCPAIASGISYYEFVITSPGCPDVPLIAFTYIHPYPGNPVCFTHGDFQPVTTSCECFNEGDNIKVDFDPATGNFTIHY